MTLPLWPLLAFAFSLCGAFIIGFNQHVKVPSRTLMVGRMAGILPLAALSMVLWKWPTDLIFYSGALGMGLLLAAGDMLLFRASRLYGGRLAALYVPLKVWLAFGLWIALQPASLTPLMQAPWKPLVLACAFVGSAYALGHIRRTDASWPALWAVAPVALIFALGDVAAKFLIAPLPGATVALAAGGATAFLFTTAMTGGVVALVSGPLNLDFAKTFGGRNMLWMGIFGAVFYAGIALLLVTLSLAPNPGYVGSVTMLSAVWLALWGTWHHNEHNNWMAVLLLVVCAMTVAFTTAHA